MLIQWLGHASFLIVSSDGTTIITDPYESGAFGGGLEYQPIQIAPDIVTVSHDHADHNYTEGLPNHFQVVSQPGSTTIGEIEITGLEAFHDAAEGSMRGMNVIFVISVDGLRVCHLGDLGHALSAEQIARLGDIDILMAPVGGYFTIDAKQADSLIEQIDPSVVIPMHFKTDKADFPIATVNDFLRGKQNVRRLDSSEFEVTRETLPEQREIVVLRHAL